MDQDCHDPLDGEASRSQRVTFANRLLLFPHRVILMVPRTPTYSEYDPFLILVPRKKYVPFFISITPIRVSPSWSAMLAFSCGVTWRKTSCQPWYWPNL